MVTLEQAHLSKVGMGHLSKFTLLYKKYVFGKVKNFKIPILGGTIYEMVLNFIVYFEKLKAEAGLMFNYGGNNFNYSINFKNISIIL